MARRASASLEAMQRLWILWSGFHDGARYARRHPLEHPSLDADRIVAMAATAGEQWRRERPPLDRALAHAVYTDGWMAGYLAARRDLASVADEAPHATGAERLDNVVIFPDVIR